MVKYCILCGGRKEKKKLFFCSECVSRASFEQRLTAFSEQIKPYKPRKPKLQNDEKKHKTTHPDLNRR